MCCFWIRIDHFLFTERIIDEILFMNKIIILLTILFSILLLSCASQRKVAYFRDMDASSAEVINRVFNETHEARIMVGDFLSIVISGLDPMVVAPFNLPVAAHTTPGTDRVQMMQALQPYIVDFNGNINFPVVGEIHLAGLTRTQAVERIEQSLKPFLRDAIVTLQFLHYQINVLGEVARPGTFIIKNERVTILEALAMAGDMTIFGKRNNVLVIRENNGELEFARLNLNSDEVFTSPFYYLQQNDVVYVEPNAMRAIASVNIPLYLSAIGTLISTVSFILLLTR